MTVSGYGVSLPARLRVVALCLLWLAAPAGAQEPPDPATSEAAVPTSEDTTAAGSASQSQPETITPDAVAEPAPVATIPVVVEETPVAEGPNLPYTFAAARLRQTDLDDASSTGMGLEVSYLLLPDIYAIGLITLSQSDDARSTESTQYELGGGYRRPYRAMDHAMDLFASIRLLHDDINSEPQSQVKMGLQADAGVRTFLMPQLEGSLALTYVERTRLARAFLSGAAFYHFMPRLSAGIEATVGSSSTAFGVLGRWTF
ncbi:MAG TPA: hypothetical protein VM240_08520 [Verrucomicrobiae bacterium]|nr:hypothetical protein [Verrucomicrobiae bacterium]